MKTVFYKKVGRKYEPVSEYDSELHSGFRHGAHLIISNPGGRSTRYNINPEFAPMIAAGRYAQDKISESLQKSTELRPADWDQFTEQEQRVWKAIKGCLPRKHRYMYTHGSCMEAVQAGVDAMQVEADKLLQHPAVKKSYDNFMLICKLAIDNKEV